MIKLFRILFICKRINKEIIEQSYMLAYYESERVKLMTDIDVNKINVESIINNMGYIIRKIHETRDIIRILESIK